MTHQYSAQVVQEALEFCARYMLRLQFIPDEGDSRNTLVVIPPPSSFAEPLVFEGKKWQSSSDNLVEAVSQAKEHLGREDG